MTSVGRRRMHRPPSIAANCIGDPPFFLRFCWVQSKSCKRIVKLNKVPFSTPDTASTLVQFRVVVSDHDWASLLLSALPSDLCTSFSPLQDGSRSADQPRYFPAATNPFIVKLNALNIEFYEQEAVLDAHIALHEEAIHATAYARGEPRTPQMSYLKPLGKLSTRRKTTWIPRVRTKRQSRQLGRCMRRT